MANPAASSVGGRRTAPEVWDRFFTARRVVNLGYGWDRTENVLWRLRHGEFEHVSPKVVVLMIGTNNITLNTPDEIAAGVSAICDEIHQRSPATRILLLGIFPRGEKPDANRATVEAVNQRLAAFEGRGGVVTYLDIGDKFLGPDRSISNDDHVRLPASHGAGLCNLGGRDGADPDTPDNAVKGPVAVVRSSPGVRPTGLWARMKPQGCDDDLEVRPSSLRRRTTCCRARGIDCARYGGRVVHCPGRDAPGPGGGAGARRHGSRFSRCIATTVVNLRDAAGEAAPADQVRRALTDARKGLEELADATAAPIPDALRKELRTSASSLTDLADAPRQTVQSSVQSVLLLLERVRPTSPATSRRG